MMFLSGGNVDPFMQVNLAYNLTIMGPTSYFSNLAERGMGYMDWKSPKVYSKSQK